MKRERLKEDLFQVVKYFVLVLAVVCVLLPIYWMVVTSFKYRLEIFAEIPTLLPKKSTLVHYINIFATRHFGNYLFNSITISLFSVGIALVAGSLATYTLTRFSLPFNLHWRLRLVILSSRIIPPIVLVVPVFMVFRLLGLVNTYAGLVLVYVGYNLPFVVWLLMGFFREVPKETEEAAMIDGATHLGIFFRITLPLVRNGLVATAIFCFILTYNEFIYGLILASTYERMTIPVGTSTLLGKIGVAWGDLAAAGTMSIIPIIIFALIVQRNLLRGLTRGALK